MDEDPIEQNEYVIGHTEHIQVARCVLASMMMSAEARLHGLSKLSPTDFVAPWHRTLFDLMHYSFWETQDEGVTKMLDACLGQRRAHMMRNEIMFIRNLVPTDANIEYYCEILRHGE
jgi:replicative DNA helicase